MEEQNFGVRTCMVCGQEFALMHEYRYTVRDEQKGGLVASMGLEVEPVMWDAFDCPYCGCQNRVGVRKREVAPEQYVCTDPFASECEDEEDGR